MRVVLASLSSLSLGEGGGEAVLLRRCKTPLVAAPPGDAAPDSDSSECMSVDSTSHSLLAILGVVTSPTASSGSRDASDDGGSKAPLGGNKSKGSTTARACSSSRCFFFLIAKSLKDILTFGTACIVGGGGGDAVVRGDECSGGGSASGRGPGTDEVWRVGEAGLGDSTRLIGGGSTRLRGSEEERDCGDGDRAS
jgi:hypothetical protein